MGGVSRRLLIYVSVGMATTRKQEPVAVLTLRTVKQGVQDQFEAALHDFITQSFNTPGQLGVHVIRPVPGSGSREYGIVRRFASVAARDSFYSSKLFHDWEETIATLVEGGGVRQELSGLEAWFTLRGAAAAAQPPRWKMAVVTLTGVYPVSIFVPWLLKPAIKALHPWLQVFFIALGIVVMLTWVVMPVLVRILKPWLYPREEKGNERTRNHSL